MLTPNYTLLPGIAKYPVRNAQLASRTAKTRKGFFDTGSKAVDPGVQSLKLIDARSGPRAPILSSRVASPPQARRER